MRGFQVRCCHCHGNGWVEDYKIQDGRVVEYYWAKDPFRAVQCPTCLGFGVVVATELKAVTNWERIEIKREPK